MAIKVHAPEKLSPKMVQLLGEPSDPAGLTYEVVQ